MMLARYLACTRVMLFAALARPASAADKVTLMLNWYVYGEHAPFYYGKDKGIYAAEGIDLDIQEGRGSGDDHAGGRREIRRLRLCRRSHDDARGDQRRARHRDRRAAADDPCPRWVLPTRTSASPRTSRARPSPSRPAIRMTQIWPLFLKKTGLKESDFKTVHGDAADQAQRRHQRPGRSPARLCDGPGHEDQGRDRQGRLSDQFRRLRHSSRQFGHHREHRLRRSKRRSRKALHGGQHTEAVEAAVEGPQGRRRRHT